MHIQELIVDLPSDIEALSREQYSTYECSNDEEKSYEARLQDWLTEYGFEDRELPRHEEVNLFAIRPPSMLES